MSNPFAVLGMNNNNNLLGQFQQMVQQLQQFRAAFKGDAKAEVEKLVQSGQLSQPQLDQLQQMARQLQGLMQ